MTSKNQELHSGVLVTKQILLQPINVVSHCLLKQLFNFVDFFLYRGVNKQQI